MSFVTLAEAKLHLRVDGTDEDALIGLYINAAEQAAMMPEGPPGEAAGPMPGQPMPGEPGSQQPLDLGEMIDQAAATGQALKRSEQARNMESKMLSHLHRVNGSLL